MRTLVSEFLKQAERHPDNVALLDIQGAITYDRANILSAYLAEKILERLGGKDRRGRIALLLLRTKAFVVSQPLCCGPDALWCPLTGNTRRNGSVRFSKMWAVRYV